MTKVEAKKQEYCQICPYGYEPERLPVRPWSKKEDCPLTHMERKSLKEWDGKK